MPTSSEATGALQQLAQGDAAAAERLFPLVYAELRALAGGYFKGQAADHTLQPTALVHEAFVRLIDHTRLRFNDRPHFFAIAATAMRQILTDHARRAAAQKRGGDRDRVGLTDAGGDQAENLVDLMALDEALTRLAALEPRQYRVVELRFFGGLDMEAIAGVIGVSKATVELDWRAARAWLGVELGGPLNAP